MIYTNLEFTAGFRWEEEHAKCPTLVIPVPPPRRHVDPFYLGVGLRLPVADHVGIGGAFDRDFTDEPRWQGRLYLSVTPWRR